MLKRLILILLFTPASQAPAFIGTIARRSSLVCNPSMPAQPNLKGYWKLNETSTGTVSGGADFADFSGHGNNMTHGGTITLGGRGKAGAGVIFDGSTGYALNNTTVNAATVTIAAWVKISAYPASDGLIVGFGQGNGSGTHDKDLIVTSAGKLKFLTYDGSNNYTSLSASAIPLNTWTHVVGSADGTTAYAYINGSQVGSVASGNSFTGYGGNDILLGGNLWGLTNVAERLDEVAVWNTALSSTGILNLYNSYASCVPPPAPTTLTFTSSPQTVTASHCSGSTTVSIDNAAISDLTVNLSGTSGVYFYSDSNCTNAISSATIADETSQTSFYFTSSSTGTSTLTAAATGLSSGNQAETISSDPYRWTGGGGNANWSTGANWAGSSAPGSGNTATFDSTCSSNCSPTIDAVIDVGGVRINPGYSGTITQGNFGVTIESLGYTQLAGTFAGSTGGTAMTVNGTFRLLGGSFTATTGTITLNGTVGSTMWAISGSPTFTAPAGSTVAFSTCFTCANTIAPGAVTYSKVTLSGSASTYNLSGGTMTVASTLTLSPTNYGLTLNSGTIMAGGNVTTSTTHGTSGSASVQLTGNGSGQTISGNGYIPNLTIAAGANNVTLSGTVNVFGNYIVTSVGTLTTTGSTLVVIGAYTTNITVTPGSTTYNNVSFTGSQTTFNLGGSTLNAAGNLTLTPSNYGMTINSGTVAVGGNVTSSGSAAVSGSGIVQLTGNGSGQTISGGGYIPNLTIAAGANNVTLSGTVSIRGDYTLTSVGTLTTTGSTLAFMAGFASSSTIVPGSATYNDVTFSGWSSTFNLSGGTLTMSGNLTLTPGTYGSNLNSGTIAVGGNVSTQATLTMGGSAIVKLTGNASGQTISGGGNVPNLTLNTGANPATAISANTIVTTNMVSTSGNLLMSGHNLTIGSSLSLNGNTITKGGGTLLVNGTTVGTGSLYGGTVN